MPALTDRDSSGWLCRQSALAAQRPTLAEPPLRAPLVFQAGLMVKDTVVDNMLTGAPAYMVRAARPQKACACLPRVRCPRARTPRLD